MAEVISDPLRKIAPKHDLYDVGFGLGLVLVVAAFGLLSVVRDGLTASHVLILVASITAFAAIYQLRHSESTVPAVRPAFEESTEDDCVDFGLKNFGPGPALYLQVIAEVDSEEEVIVEPQVRPIHLGDGDFVGIVHDPCIETRLQLDEIDEDGEIELYYSYVSTGGLREPRELNGKEGDATFFKDELTGEEQDPRTIEVKTIRDVCT